MQNTLFDGFREVTNIVHILITLELWIGYFEVRVFLHIQFDEPNNEQDIPGRAKVYLSSFCFFL